MPLSRSVGLTSPDRCLRHRQRPPATALTKSARLLAAKLCLHGLHPLTQIGRLLEGPYSCEQNGRLPDKSMSHLTSAVKHSERLPCAPMSAIEGNSAAFLKPTSQATKLTVAAAPQAGVPNRMNSGRFSSTKLSFNQPATASVGVAHWIPTTAQVVRGRRIVPADRPGATWPPYSFSPARQLAGSTDAHTDVRTHSGRSGPGLVGRQGGPSLRLPRGRGHQPTPTPNLVVFAVAWVCRGQPRSYERRSTSCHSAWRPI
jgi:hypothetical protein